MEVGRPRSPPGPLRGPTSPASGEVKLHPPRFSLRHPQAENRPERPPDLSLGDLGGAGHAVLEPDRHLDHRVTEADRAMHHLDLELVALRLDLVVLDRGEQRSRVAPEAGRAVADAQPEQRAAVDVGARGEEEPVRRPADELASPDVATADGEAAAAPRRVYDRVQVLRAV